MRSYNKIHRLWRVPAFSAMAMAAACGWPLGAAADDGEFNARGNVLIADQFNNRVIEIDRESHEIVWRFGTGSDKPGPDSVVGTNDAERVGMFTLISGTGIPPTPTGSPPLPGCSDPVNGCPDNRVLLVDRRGRIVWQYGAAGVTGAGPNQLNTPVHSLFLSSFPGHPGFHVMITDQGNQRVIVVNASRQIVWQFGTTGVAGNGSDQLNNPNSAELLENGHVLIADESNNRAIEVAIDSMQVVAQFTVGGTASGVAFASRLEGGNTLITDSNNNRIVEVDKNDTMVSQYLTNTTRNSNANPLPTRAVRLRNGDTLISDQFNERVIQVTPDQRIVFQQGQLNVAGSGSDRLNGPYDAKVVGDYTGLTPPFDFEAWDLPIPLR
jgi:outer membrane protein assembly factor BamB